jgi:DNA polymerase-1
MNQPIRDDRKTFFIIDGSSYIYRAFYAIRRLTNSKGMATQAVYGFLTMLLKVIRERKPEYICVVFDAGRSFRHDMFESYKATRQVMPEELGPQIPYIKKVVEYCGVPQMELEGYEADDLIASLTHWASAHSLDIVVVSGDKDLHQLIVDPAIRQWDPQNDRLFTEQVVAERFGVSPSQMVDYLALVGDTSDNVPGVKGIGDKTASQLLQKWKSLDSVYDHIDEISPDSVRKKLAAGKESAFLSRELVSLKLDVLIEKKIEEFAPVPPHRQEMYGLCEELEFRNLTETLKREWADLEEPQAMPVRQPTRARVDHIIRTREELSRVLRLAEGKSLVSIELETTSQDAMNSSLVAVALCWENDSAYYIPVGHCDPECGGQITAAVVLDELESILGSSTPAKAGHNLKFQWVVLKRHGIELKGMVFDAMIASYLLDPGKQTHALERIAAEFLGEAINSYGDMTGRGKGQVSFADVEVEKAADYACCDVETTFRIVPALRKSLEENGALELYELVELPLTEVLAEMEYRGILVDSERLEMLSLEFEKALDQRAARIYELCGEEFNIQSPKQLGYILFEKLHLPVLKKTKSGPSTDISVLEELAAENPVAEEIVSYRTLSKLKGTYADALPKLVHRDTGRIHTSFNQTVTATGRLSSSNPNLQNIPIRTEEGKKIREAFIAAPGNVLLSADYSQIELRVLAHYSGDKSLREAFENDEDVHTRTAAEIFGVADGVVSAEMRRQAKMINFGIAYGMSPFGLAQRLRISTKIAKAAIDRYFERYSGVRRFIDEVVIRARESGYAETLLGRRRAIPELQSRNHTIRQLGERLAINTPIQGTSADLIKKAMIDIQLALKYGGYATEMLLQVHDELLFEVPREEEGDVQEMIQRLMEEVWSLDVPLKVEVGWGTNWAEAHP